VNFFEHQERARGTTRKLVVLFSAAVLSLILITTALLIVVLAVADSKAPEAGLGINSIRSDIAAAVSAVVLLVVMLGTLFRLTQLRSGGKAVAESLGGRLLNLGTRNANERKILNVVEEMAIAAGVPVPQVYLLDDPAINAFAAGYEPRDAVIGITQGCIEQLDRNELQGVIAHEFSHIFNGDMRLNIRLIGWLYGITVIGLIGYYLMRGQTYRFGGSRNDNSRGAIVMLGIGLIIIGYGGTFFGNLIKAAVSRQREFLADASAVQFTRNPESIGGALKKIGGYAQGSVLTRADASEFSHLLFSQGVKAGFTGLFATHPPLEARIKRIEPRWDGKFVVPEPRTAPEPEPEAAVSPRHMAGAGLVGHLINSVGEPDPEHLQKAAEQILSIPDELMVAVHNTLGGCLTMHALIVSCSSREVAQQQLKFLHEHLKPAHYREFQRLQTTVASLPRPLYLPLVELAMPGLRQLSRNQFPHFMSHLHKLMDADGQISLFEWCLFKILRFNLDKPSPGRLLRLDLNQCESAVGQLFTALASAGSKDATDAAAAYADAVTRTGITVSGAFQWQDILDLKQLDAAFDRLQGLAPLQKPRLLKAMVRCVEHDGRVTVEEAELIRAASAILDCPMPPLTLPVSQDDAGH